MPFTTPTLPALISRVTADVVSRLELTAPLLARDPAKVLAEVFANVVHGNYGYLRYIIRQFFAHLANEKWLARHGAEYGVPRKAASFAVGSVDFTGTDTTVIPAGTLLQTSAGAQYATDADVTIVAGVATASVTAVEAGIAGNAAAATALTLVSPITGVSSAVVASGGITGGVDIEPLEDWRTRILQRKRNTPMGGAASDYIRWALTVSGITRAWVNDLGAGTVNVRVVMDDQPGTILPGQPKLDEVAAYIDTQRPVTASVNVLAPTLVPIDITIALTPNTTEVQTAVTAELVDLLRREAAPGSTILLSHIHEAISTAAGETDHDLPAPVADVNTQAGEIAVLGTITFV